MKEGAGFGSIGFLRGGAQIPMIKLGIASKEGRHPEEFKRTLEAALSDANYRH